MKSKRHYPPSYYRYKEKHKTITIQVPNDLYYQIDAIKGNKTYAQFIKDLLINEVKELNEWWQAGYDEAKNDFGISVPCALCGEPVYAMQGTDLYNHIKELIAKEKWYHMKCYEQKYGKKEK